MIFSTKRLFLLVFLLNLLAPFAFSQEALKVDVDKPEKFENKKLGYEKTDEKKFTLPRRFIQNTTTHYNYFFNANAKLEAVLERTKAGHQDNYELLLPFYNFSLEKTAVEKQELDSVIYKVTVGILIHDLRNSWLDDMYMLMGKAYYYRNELDSAWQTFQYINYAFSPKESDGYDLLIGSNANEGGNAFSISTKEKRNLVKKVFTEPPGRNESFIWQIRTYLQRSEYAEAAGLIETLKNDPNFPSRLQTDLREVQAFWFYRQNIYDSAAKYLELALPNAVTKNEEARWEYLIAQLYERSNEPANAEKFYARAIKHTYDPVLEVFARLNSLRQNEEGEENKVQRNIDELLKMAKRDKYFNYRDLIYYTAAQMELDRKNIPAANALLLRSIRYNSGNEQQRNRSFLQLAEIAFANKNYQVAKNYYDSINVTETLVPDLAAFNERKNALGKIVIPLGILYRQDSLQRIAAMPEKEREAFVRKMVRQLRRSQGLKEDEVAGSPVSFNNNNAPVVDLFNNADKGVWYFDNPSIKARGFTEFRAKWGERPNVDNWRRIAAVRSFAQSQQVDNRIGDVPPFASGSTEITYDALSGKLPLTEDLLRVSNDSIQNALMQLGTIYQQNLEEYKLAIDQYEKLLDKYPDTQLKQDAWFNLYYSYWKLNDQAKAAYYKGLLQQKFPAGKYVKALDPNAAAKSPDSLLKIEATKAYQSIYNNFIEGNFDSAIAAKKQADAMFGKNFWNPQLSYIEAVYYIKQRNDSTAKMLLSDIIYRFNNTPLAPKAQNLLSVLNRRQEIETYLTNLNVERAREDSISGVVDNPLIVQKPDVTGVQPVIRDTVIKAPPVKKDTLQKINPIITPPSTSYSFNPQSPQLVMIVLDKVDPVYVSETRNAFNRYNREKYYNKVIEIVNVPLDDNLKLVILNNFDNADAAIDYVEKVKKVAPTEIVPWLPAGKYSFLIISAANLEMLKASKDIEVYKRALNSAFPGRF